MLRRFIITFIVFVGFVRPSSRRAARPTHAREPPCRLVLALSLVSRVSINFAKVDSHKEPLR